ncbi:MAG: elongation factor P Efp [Bacteroidetes bacterium HLUCCA01]|nr:MAG: elongation factor P Efp [Bacteroidetes bacterium HLUCCA01]
MPKITTADFKNGMNILMNNEIYTIIEFLHVKPGKGGAFVRSKLRGVTNGKVLDKTFRAGESMESVRVERHPYQYLYHDGEVYHFMHEQTYDQVGLNAAQVDKPEFMKESEVVTFVINADTEKVLFTELPDHVVLEVVETEPGMKGDTATGATKPAKLESGVSLQVPLFINQGDKLRVDTRTSSYIERVKS